MRKFFAFIIIIFLLTSSLCLFNPRITNASENNKKVVLLVMDYIDTKDLIVSQTPNLDKLIKDSGTGLMNIRAKNRYPSSSYMSIAVGYRVGTVTHAELSYNSNEPVLNLPNIFESDKPYWTAGELYRMFTGLEPPSNGIVNLYTEKLRKSAYRYNPQYEIGQVGKISKLNDLKVTVLGNADTIDIPNRNVVLLGMDENGLVSQGNVSKELLEYDPLVAGGVKTNHTALIEAVQYYLPLSDLLIIDLGDTTRVEESRLVMADNIVLNQRNMAIERNDKFIGKLLNCLDMQSTMLIVITPNPNKEMLEENNFGLTPVIIYDPTQHGGTLLSSSTRRSGLITNADILPTIFNFLDADYVPTTTSNSVTILPASDNSINYLNEMLQLFKNLRAARNPLHMLLIVLVLLTFTLGFITYQQKRYSIIKYLYVLTNMVLSIPVVWMFISFTNYQSILGSLLITLLIGILIGLLLNLLFNPINSIFIITGVTSLLLAIDCFTGSQLMLVSPLGSDAIAGGRYYGVGNDFMGILLASSVIFVTLLANYLKNPYLKTIFGVLYLLTISIAIGHPNFGANVGGLITSLITVGVFALFITNRKINLRKLAIVGILAIIIVLGVAQLDALFNPNPSHAGRTINSLLTGGYKTFFSIIRTKLGILVNTIFTSYWSIVMISSLALLSFFWLKSKEILAAVALKTPGLMTSIRILLVSGVTVFIVNDTGVIASALIFTYLVSCLWISMSEI